LPPSFFRRVILRMSNKSVRARSRGRPKGEARTVVRTQLLSSARELFMRYGFRAVSARQIATHAGVNSAMVRYYFGGKRGLFEAMLEQFRAPTLQRFRDSLATQGGADIFELLTAHARHTAANAWVAGLVAREVLPPDGALRQSMSREMAQTIVPMIAEVIRRGVRNKIHRSTLDPELATLSMLSLLIFPFLAESLLAKTFGSLQDSDFFERWLQHTVRLLRAGFAPGGAHVA
jgi:AcrR family transcriptional regulator